MRLAWLLVLAGCSKGPSGEDCKVAAKELGTFLTTMDHDASLYLDPSNLELATRDLPPPQLHEAPVVYVKPNAYVIDANVFEAKAVSAKLGEMHARIVEDVAAGKVPRNWPEEAPSWIHLVIDARVPWSRVVEIAGIAAASGFVRPWFVFARPPKTPPPPATDSSRELEALMAHTEEKASALADYTKPVVERCPSLIAAFGKVSVDEAGDRTANLLAAVEPALVACDCAVDLEKLRATLWAVAGNPSPKATIQIILDRDAPPIVQPATTPWREANAKLVAGAHVWLR